MMNHWINSLRYPELPSDEQAFMETDNRHLLTTMKQFKRLTSSSSCSDTDGGTDDTSSNIRVRSVFRYNNQATVVCPTSINTYI
jgi:hypothetical protein